jgi:glycine/D-amino acid oxidase-like deaminating enzyme
MTKLVENYGAETARAIQLAMYESVDDVGRVCETEGIDAHYAKTGVVNIARMDHELDQQRERVELFRTIGLPDHYELLDAAGVDEHLRVARSKGGLFNRQSATVHPARLARGLARAVERHGGTIYEQTRVTDYVPGPRSCWPARRIWLRCRGLAARSCR